MSLSIQQNLRRELTRLNLSQRDFARRFDCIESTLSQWLNGWTEVPRIRNIALCFMFIYGSGRPSLHDELPKEAYPILDRLIGAARTHSSDALRSALQSHMLEMKLQQDYVAYQALVPLSQLREWLAGGTGEYSTDERVSIKVHAYLALQLCVPPLKLVTVQLDKQTDVEERGIELQTHLPCEAGSSQLQQHAATSLSLIHI